MVGSSFDLKKMYVCSSANFFYLNSEMLILFSLTLQEEGQEEEEEEDEAYEPEDVDSEVEESSSSEESDDSEDWSAEESESGSGSLDSDQSEGKVSVVNFVKNLEIQFSKLVVSCFHIDYDVFIFLLQGLG